MATSRVPAGARLAAVDIGTNSVLLTVAGRGPGGRLTPVHDSCRIPRLGEGMAIRQGRLDPDAVRRTLDCLRELRIEAQAHGAGEIIVAGTEVLRAAHDSAEFVRAAEQALGAPIEVLSGDREARLAWLGVTGGRYPARPTALLDVGGGSTEYIRATTRGIFQPLSIAVGAVRLRDAVPDGNPPTLAALAAEALAGGGLIPHPGDRLVTVGGTATTLVAVLKELKKYEPKEVEGARLGMADVLGLLNRLWTLDREDRLLLPGMDADRVDTIVPGAVLLAVAMKTLGARDTSVSTRGLRHGLLLEAFGIGEGRRSSSAAPAAGAGA